MTGLRRHRAFIFDRGAETQISEIHGATQISWSRVKDDISTAGVRAVADECAKVIEPRHVGRYELVVTRDGRREWEGPITRVAWDGPNLAVDAKDILHYTNRTVMKEEWDNSRTAVAFCVDRLQEVFQVELAHKEDMIPSYNILRDFYTITNPEGARTTRRTLPYQKYVWQELDDMAWRAGIDYSCTRRSIGIWDTDEEIGRTRTLTDVDFSGELAVTAYGMEVCTMAYVTDGEGRAGWSGADDPYYGNVELLATEYTEGDDSSSPGDDDEEDPPTSIAELASQAQRNRSGRLPTPTVVRVPQNSMLNPATADELLPKLVAGMNVPVRLTSRSMPQLYQMQRLNSMEVTENSEGERVSVSLGTAPGATALDPEGEGGE